MPYILDNALEAVGHTPLIRLDRLAKAEGLKCNLLGKVEYTSIGGSVKDRIAKAMVEAAERDGRLVKGKSIVIEPTSGNTGIGLAMACAIKGYSVIITMPAKMSLEKELLLRALGAEVIRTPSDAAFDSEESHIGVAKKLARKLPGGIILDQYGNPNNPFAHESTTGPEIIEAVTSTESTADRPSSGKVDAFVAGAGTGGTISGVSRSLKKDHNPQCIVVGIDPKGSVLAQPESLNSKVDDAVYVVEGIGYDFVPDVLTRSDVDEWLKTDDEESWTAVANLMRQEGLLVGGSSGSALSGALRWLRSERGSKLAQTPGANIVVLFADGIRNYMSKPWFVDGQLKTEESHLRGLINQVIQ